jgi:hypothetical protein
MLAACGFAATDTTGRRLTITICAAERSTPGRSVSRSAGRAGSDSTEASANWDASCWPAAAHRLQSNAHFREVLTMHAGVNPSLR